VITPPPGVTGAITWNYCDPDDPTWPNCAAGQTQLANPPPPSDPQSGFCVQISDDSTFADPAFSGGTAGCGVTHMCGVIGAGSGCVSGALVGTAPSCSFGTPVSCMPGGAFPNNLLYNHQYFYRTKVEDTNAWGGQSGGGGGGGSGLPTGQLAYWKLDDATVPPVLDSSGNGYNGTCTAGTTCPVFGGAGAQGFTGSSAAFDGVNDNIITTLGNSVKGLAQVSLSLWFNTNTITTQRWLYSEETSSIAAGVRFGLYLTNTGQLSFQAKSPDNGTLTTLVTIATPVSLNTWSCGGNIRFSDRCPSPVS
jgi:hypothetical protein